jgi:hypothetical protein
MMSALSVGSQSVAIVWSVWRATTISITLL